MKKGHAGNTVTAYDEGNMKHGSSAVLLMQSIASSIRDTQVTQSQLMMKET